MEMEVIKIGLDLISAQLNKIDQSHLGSLF